MSGNRYDKRKYLGKGDSLPNPPNLIYISTFMHSRV